MTSRFGTLPDGRPVAAVTLQNAAGMEVTIVEWGATIVRWLVPVYAGDTLYPLLEVSELKPQNTTGVLTLRSTVHNQRDELVLEGLQRYLIRKRAI